MTNTGRPRWRQRQRRSGGQPDAGQPDQPGAGLRLRRADEREGSIGNQVWEDLNADGIRQAGEPAIAGVTVDLYRDLNGNGTVDPGEPLMGTRITDVNGQYLFSALPIVGGGDADPEAEYVVDVTDVNGVLAGYWHSLAANQDPNTGVSGNTANDANDRSKVDPFAIEIGSGSGGQPVSNNLNVDFGYYVKPASVGNFVWQDLNSNGIQDLGQTGHRRPQGNSNDLLSGRHHAHRGDPHRRRSQHGGHPAWLVQLRQPAAGRGLCHQHHRNTDG